MMNLGPRTPLRNSSFKRKEYIPPGSAPLRKLDRTPNYSGSTSGVAVVKTPALRSQALRDLANGETCTVCMGGRCDPATTVWAHTNTLSDNKGMGYKASDERGFFAGDECHRELDQGSHLSPDDKRVLVLQAQIRTQARLREIAGNVALKPWRVKAAQWALQQLNAT